MCDPARDSGISVDNDDNESQVTMTSRPTQCNDCENLSYVQRLKKHFEKLACESDSEYHTECNWWLDVNGEQELNVDNGVRNPVMIQEHDDDVVEDMVDLQSNHESHHSEETDVFESHPKPVIMLTEFSDNDTEHHNSDDSFESEDEYKPSARETRPVSMSSQNSK